MSSLLNYFQRTSGVPVLPNPSGSLSSSVSSQTISEANRHVEKEMNKVKEKRGPYKRYYFSRKIMILPLNSVDTAQKLGLILEDMLVIMV